MDSSESKDALVQGFTTCEVEDLPTGIPARSHADNLYDSETPYDADKRNFAFAGVDDADRTVAYPNVQFGRGPSTCHAEDCGVEEVGDYTDSGMGKLGKGWAGMGDPAPNKNPIDKR